MCFVSESEFLLLDKRFGSKTLVYFLQLLTCLHTGRRTLGFGYMCGVPNWLCMLAQRAMSLRSALREQFESYTFQSLNPLPLPPVFEMMHNSTVEQDLIDVMSPNAEECLNPEVALASCRLERLFGPSDLRTPDSGVCENPHSSGK